jgi:class 3 adenylate cyclase
MDFSGITAPTRAELLISFMDIQGFTKITEKIGDSLAVFGILDEWSRLAADGIKKGGGFPVKFIGDACMAVYPGDGADDGIRSLLSVKTETERYFVERGFPTRLRVTCHFGEVAIGRFGPERAIDIHGDAVNVAATLERNDRRARMIISPQAFRKLGPETRKLFHKFTPPIVYVAEEG